ncbi:magnesium transporter CorA family protein [Sphingomonas humi]|uniref:Magnesium transporter CorA family protein n=1 Tax=Sphingomonas humi TaxID=335630 RepID=A0ABP7RP65_9SPHN
MMRTYGPACDGSLVEAEHAHTIPPTATWIDLEEPTREEEVAVERLTGIAIPTRDDMVEIEPSSRLYEENGALFMTLSTLCGVEDGMPTTEPIAFVLAKDKLVTVRYATPKPVRVFVAEMRRRPELAGDAMKVMLKLLDAIVDRTADELERSGAEMEELSRKIFHERVDERRIPAKNLTALLSRIGRAQSLLARVRETNVSTLRLLTFLAGTERLHGPGSEAARDRITSLQADVTALLDHAGYLGDDLTFQLDASLGLISIEQNAAMKLFSWVAIVFMPPTLIAGIFGMNFKYMPELDEVWGYPMSLALMLLSAILPLVYLKRRGWI